MASPVAPQAAGPWERPARGRDSLWAVGASVGRDADLSLLEDASLQSNERRRTRGSGMADACQGAPKRQARRLQAARP